MSRFTIFVAAILTFFGLSLSSPLAPPAARVLPISTATRFFRFPRGVGTVYLPDGSSVTALFENASGAGAAAAANGYTGGAVGVAAGGRNSNAAYAAAQPDLGAADAVSQRR